MVMDTSEREMEVMRYAPPYRFSSFFAVSIHDLPVSPSVGLDLNLSLIHI